MGLHFPIGGGGENAERLGENQIFAEGDSGRGCGLVLEQEGGDSMERPSGNGGESPEEERGTGNRRIRRGGVKELKVNVLYFRSIAPQTKH